MSGEHDKGRYPGRLRRLSSLLTRPSTRYGAGILVFAGVIAGAGAWQGLHVVVARTNTLEFCTSCHEMKAFVYPEYAESPHYSNASGVRITCADCHVPASLGPKLYAKTRATMVELPRHFLGKISTEERFLAHKEELAERVWERMKGNDSQECRKCHSWEAMSESVQPLRAWREHVEGRDAGETCIDCHKGIAHSLPESMLEADEDELDFDF